jgi:RNA polymerase sigma-70 factor (ECF subfamily)
MEPLASTAAVIPATGRAELVRQAARGDAHAFEELVAAHADGTFRTARAILGNESDARDATQDAFVSAWRELPRLRDAHSFEPWLRRILVNVCRSQMRGRRRVREISLDVTFDRRDPSPLVAEQVGDTELLAHAFDRLDPDKRTILVLHYLNHEPVASIADALGIPVGTAKWRLSEARTALQRALAAEGEARS